MPFGKKPHPTGGGPIDFDEIYETALLPAIRAAGLRAHRDDLVAVGGIVQKQIYEALLLCDYAIADLTTQNANVFYELGVRHAVRPSSTLTITALPDSIPFDVRYLRSVRYDLDERNALPVAAAAALSRRVGSELSRLKEQVARRPEFADSPLFQLVDGWRPRPPESLKTDLFAERVEHDEKVRQRLARARAAGKRGEQARVEALAGVIDVRADLGDVGSTEAGLVIDLYLTYRALEDWDAMIELAESMPAYLRGRALVQEQLAFALNRRAKMSGDEDRDHALALLRVLDDEGRASSETLGIMGRVCKDRWRESTDARDRPMHLLDAIEAYERGFQLDPRDPFPGVNALTLSRLRGAPEDEARLSRLLPVVEYAAHRLLATERPTYWMHATLLEIAVLRHDRQAAENHLFDALRAVREIWEPRSTAQNISDLLINNCVQEEHRPWVEEIDDALRSAIKS